MDMIGWFLSVMGLILVCICIDSYFGLSTGGPSPVAPAFRDHTPVWHVGAAPGQMCLRHGGVEQVLPVGGSTGGHLLSGSQVACRDGAIENVS